MKKEPIQKNAWVELIDAQDNVFYVGPALTRKSTGENGVRVKTPVSFTTSTGVSGNAWYLTPDGIWGIVLYTEE